MRQFVPQLVASDQPTQIAAKAVIFATYPNDAYDIFRYVEDANPSKSGSDMQNAIIAAKKLRDETGDWGIVTYHRRSLHDAARDCQRSMPENTVQNCLIYKRLSGFIVIVGPFPNNDSAQVAEVSVRSLQNPTAYVVNLKSYCQDGKHVDESGVTYLDCTEGQHRAGTASE